MKEVVVLQHAECEGLGAIKDVLDKELIRIRTVRSYAGERVPEWLGGAAGLIVMGGPMAVYEQERYPFLRDELSLIQRTVAERRPVLGVCLGCQLLAAALGGMVYPGRKKEIGWYPVRLTAEAEQDNLWAGVPQEFTTFHWHGDVFTLPAGAVPLLSSALTERQAFRYGPNAYGLLFHLEVTRPLIDGMVTSFAEELREAGTSPDDITAGRIAYLPSLQSIGEAFFARWSGLLGREHH